MSHRKKNLAQLLIATLTILLLIPTSIISAQDSQPQDLQPLVTIDFGERINFSIQIHSSTAPVRAALFLRPSPDSRFDAHIGEIEAGQTSAVEIGFEPQALNLLPFAQLEYYWQIDFEDGSIQTTDIVRVTYLDERFAWQEFSRDRLTVHWVDGGIDWGQDLLSIAEAALPKIQTLIAVPSSGQRHIYIYPGQAELRNSLRQAGINQASAHTLPELGVMLLAGENDSETLIRFEREIPHELVHLLLYERMGPAIDNLPVWLNEGLSTYFEQSPRPVYSNALEEAHEEDALIDMESLCASFPISESGRILAYAQSESFTNYLLDVYGTGGIVRLLDAYQEGTSCTGGVQRVYQRSLLQLEEEWRQVTFGDHSTLPISMLLLYLGIGVGITTAALIVALLIRRRSK
jgi:hypothetical protein